LTIALAPVPQSISLLVKENKGPNYIGLAWAFYCDFNEPNNRAH
jgi:hypothetical protein